MKSSTTFTLHLDQENKVHDRRLVTLELSLGGEKWVELMDDVEEREPVGQWGTALRFVTQLPRKPCLVTNAQVQRTWKTKHHVLHVQCLVQKV